MKKIGVLVFLCLIFFAQVVYAEGVLGDLEEKIEGIEDTKENIEEGVENIKETKWDYLGEKWKSAFLKNKFVSVADGFFQKINFLFVVLFSENYSLSLILFFIIILWFSFFFKLSEVLTDYSTFSSFVATAIGFGLVIIIAQLKFFRVIVESFVWLVFSSEAWWLRLIIFIVIVFVVVFLYKLSSQVGNSFKKNKEKTKEEMEKIEEKINRGIIKTFADTIVKSLK